MADTAAPVASATPTSASSAPAGQVPVTDNSVTQTSNAGSTSPKSPQPAQQKPQEQPSKKYKLKIDGRDEEYGETDLIKLAQMGRAADRRFQEAAQARKQAEEFIRMLKSDPKSVLSNPAIGIDVRKFAEEYLANELKREQLSPEQKRIKELEEKLQKESDDKRKIEQERQAEQQRQLEDHFAQDYDTKMTAALSSSGLPKSPRTVKRMAEYISLGIQNGLEDIQPQDVVALVRQDYMAEVQELLGQSDGDSLLQILGDGVANKIRKSDLARIKRAAQKVDPNFADAPQVSSQSQDSAPEKPSMPRQTDAGPKKIGIHEWREQMEKRRQTWK